MPVVTKTVVPSGSALEAAAASADFCDAYAAPLVNGILTPTEIFLRAVRATPPWVERLMAVRNAVVRRLGLKDVGTMRVAENRTAESFRIGDQIGIFTIFGQSTDELVLGIDDRHLDVRVSVLKARSGAALSYVVSTVVTVHNRLGHLYMFPVGGVHPVVVRAMMRRTIV